MKIFSCAILLSLGITAQAAHAVTALKFEYAATAGILSGQMVGDLDSANGTMIVHAVKNFTSFNGVAGPALKFVANGGYLFNGNISPAYVYTTGPVSITACNDANCVDGFILQSSSPAVAISSPAFGDIQETFDPQRFKVTAVPEPEMWSLVIAGFCTVGSALRRRRPVAAAA